MLPISLKSYAGMSITVKPIGFLLAVLVKADLSLLLRDTPSERLGNLKNGVKDIQKHK